MAVCDITVIPAKYDGNSYELVDKIIDIIKDSNLKYKVGAMSTVVEGDSEELFKLAYILHKKAFELGAKDVITQFRIHESLLYDDTIEGKTYKY
ncbi:MAG: thiamine-binding protein [Spirochaetes bacterium]|nr:thiamine-binding protein [Spirochaetota bacterium]